MDYLSCFAQWAVPVYFSSGIVHDLAVPSVIRGNSKETAVVAEICPEVFEEEENLRHDIYLYRDRSKKGDAMALGSNFSPHALILYNEEYAKSPGLLGLMIKHELCHIKNNDAFVASSLATIASSISAYAIPYMQSFLPWWASPVAYLVPLLVGKNTVTLTNSLFEQRADHFANGYATVEELEGTLNFYQANIEVCKELHAKYPNLFTADGNTRLGLGGLMVLTPTKTSRVEEIQAELRRRNITKNEVSPEEMNQLKEIHKNYYRNDCKLEID